MHAARGEVCSGTMVYGNGPFANHRKCVWPTRLAMRYAVARQRLSQWLAFGLSLLAMISRPSATLPKQYQLALDAFRDKPDSRCAALEADAFTREEDACILHNTLLITKKQRGKMCFQDERKVHPRVAITRS